METRDLLLVIGFLRGAKMFPIAIPMLAQPAARSLRLLLATIDAQERALFANTVDASHTPVTAPPQRGAPADFVATAEIKPGNEREELKRRCAVTAWSGDYLAWSSRIGDVPDPGVVLFLVYDGPAEDAALPIDVFAQTLRRYTLREAAMRERFEAHVDAAGTFVPPSLAPEARRKRSQDAFDRAMKVAREQGFAAAAPLFEGVRGDCFATAQIAIAVHELRELGEAEAALARLEEVVRVAPRNVAAHMQRAQILSADPGRRVEAAADWLAVLRETTRLAPGDDAAAPGVRETAKAGLLALQEEFANARELEAAAALVEHDPERGFEAVSRYVHTHPCAWDAQRLLASLALARQSFELTAKLLGCVRWLYEDDPNPHFVYGQALASKGAFEGAVQAIEHAARLAPADGDIAHWLAFARGKLTAAAPIDDGVAVAHHVARTLLLLVGFVRGGRVHPAALVLHRVPGDVSLALVVQALAVQEQRRFGAGDAQAAAVEPPVSGERPSTPDGDLDLRAVGERAVLLDDGGAELSVEQLVGDVPDPGVLIALLYESVSRDASGRRIFAPPPDECRAAIAAIARTNTEIAAKLERHKSSSDATMMARLDLAG